MIDSYFKVRVEWNQGQLCPGLSWGGSSGRQCVYTYVCVYILVFFPQTEKSILNFWGKGHFLCIELFIRGLRLTLSEDYNIYFV